MHRKYWTYCGILDNFKWILEEAINIGVYKKQDFKLNNVEYCGMTITDSPLN